MDIKIDNWKDDLVIHMMMAETGLTRELCVKKIMIKKLKELQNEKFI